MAHSGTIPSALSHAALLGTVLILALCTLPVPCRAEEGFVPTELDPGEKILAWTVEEVRTYTDTEGSYCSVVFSGRVELEGAYQIVPPAYDMAPQPCFWPDDASTVLLPRAQYDIRRAWFCFSNQEQVLEMLGDRNRTARVVIDSYRYIFVPYDAFNEATLLEAP